MAYVNLGQVMYPVGAIYASGSSISPAALFGGTWEQITNAALRGAASVGYIGSDEHKLTINEMPAHNHNFSDGWAGYAANQYRTGQDHIGSISVCVPKVENNGYNSFDTSSNKTGGAAHTNVQRSYNCYMWQRKS